MSDKPKRSDNQLDPFEEMAKSAFKKMKREQDEKYWDECRLKELMDEEYSEGSVGDA